MVSRRVGDHMVPRLLAYDQIGSANLAAGIQVASPLVTACPAAEHATAADRVIGFTTSDADLGGPLLEYHMGGEPGRVGLTAALQSSLKLGPSHNAKRVGKLRRQSVAAALQVVLGKLGHRHVLGKTRQDLKDVGVVLVHRAILGQLRMPGTVVKGHGPTLKGLGDGCPSFLGGRMRLRVAE